jgi:hypothetical protein
MQSAKCKMQNGKKTEAKDATEHTERLGLKKILGQSKWEILF